MPDVKELFRAATDDVMPHPGALQRQHRGQRRRSIRRRSAVYGLVASLLAACVVAAVDVASRGDGEGSVNGSHTPSASAPAVALTPQHASVVALDGTILRTIPGLPDDAYGLVLSPDGTRIAFLRGSGAIATIGMDGQGLANLDISIAAGTLAWSPDGARLAFSGLNINGNVDIYVVDANGSNLHRLTGNPSVDEWPSWSPDGLTIVYDNIGARPADGDGFSSTSELYTVPASGGRTTRLTTDEVDDAMPAYSPDGSMIAYHHEGQIWVMDADGRHPHLAAALPCCSFTPTWSPDGSRLAFTTYDGSWRARISYDELPVVRVHLLDLSAGRIFDVGDAEVATDANPPQWLPSGDALLLNLLVHP
jgi:Tol biopolymer transport system component